MATPRSQQIDLSVTPYYHCVSRCVRRAFLCGKDGYTGENFEHRRGWVRGRLRVLAKLFAIDVCAYAVMSNHMHVIIRVDEARMATWSDEEVIDRYTTLFPNTKLLLECQEVTSRNELVASWRSRLCSVSWLMRCLSEFIARKANNEDCVTGRFWEGRFRSQALADDAGLLTCMAYVDLNPLRAGMAQTLERADFTSLQERMRLKKQQHPNPSHLAPFVGQEGDGRHPLPISLEEYYALVEGTAQAIAEKKARLQSSTLSTFGISSKGWLTTLQNQDLSGAGTLGLPGTLERIAISRNRQWARGIGAARCLADSSGANV